VTLINLGDVRTNLGDLAAAHEAYTESYRLTQEIGQRSVAAYALAGLGKVLLLRGDQAAARTKHERALAVRQELDDSDAVAESRLALAEVALEEGKATEAEAAARAALAAFEKAKSVQNEVLALTVLARTLLAQNDIAGARTSIERAVTVAAGSASPIWRLVPAATAARIRAASGDVGATADLRAVVAKATEFGLIGHQWEARLALAEIQLESDPRRARSALRAVEQEAAEKGFVQIARKAAAIQTRVIS
jgi:tetratricopeptide (TPR) repeat protein